MLTTSAKSAKRSSRNAGKDALDNTYLQIHPSCLAPIINSSLTILLLVTCIASSAPIVLTLYVVITFGRTYWLHPALKGQLILTSSLTTLNNIELISPRYFLAFHHWFIGMYDQNNGWRLLWRDSCDESAYRRLILVIKKQPD
ncbi:hypothetical protein [Vibrio thalassae]|uniref:hypothetical protein n=1 Tax=Vibrio thalassae TaxID=1243014 RepID=UPI000BE13964|nr:hypothetical protein [Vibrio thalassae]